MKAIAAVSENWGIGKDNGLLFHIKEDMRFFRAVTAGNVVIMGRKTLESFPGGRPLPKRVNIVLTRDRNFYRDGAIIVHSPEDALAQAALHKEEAFVIGGGEIYSLFLDRCRQCLITKVSARPQADSFFPDLDALPQWFLAESSEEKEENGLKFRFTTYQKR